MRAFALVSACLVVGARAHAQAGETAAALPGIVHVGVPVTAQQPLSLAASAGYGVTESQAGEGVHHRAAGSLAAALGATPWLAFGLRFDGRYDVHPADARGHDDGFTGDPQLYARAGYRLSPALALGGELAAFVPGDKAPSFEPKATTLDVKALLAWFNQSRLVLAGLLGVRWDNSARAAPSNMQLRTGDRLALGASDFNALLLGFGASQRIDSVEVLTELSADVLVGRGAPRFTHSRLRASAGARYYPFASLSALAFELTFDTSLSGRPVLEATSPRIPIEPRFTAMLGLRYAFTHAAEPPPSASTPAAPRPAPARAPTAQPTPETTAQPAEAAGATEDSAPSSEIRGLVRSFHGRGLPARIAIAALGLQQTADAQGRFQLELPPGQYEVTIEFAGFAAQTRSVTVEPNGVTLLNVELRGATP